MGRSYTTNDWSAHCYYYYYYYYYYQTPEKSERVHTSAPKNSRRKKKKKSTPQHSTRAIDQTRAQKINETRLVESFLPEEGNAGLFVIAAKAAIKTPAFFNNFDMQGI